MTSPQCDIARGSGAIDPCPYCLLRSPYALCASVRPAKDFYLRSTVKLAGEKGQGLGGKILSLSMFETISINQLLTPPSINSAPDSEPNQLALL